MADDDNFDIDIYGDDAPQESFQQDSSNNAQESNAEGHTESMPDAHQATEDVSKFNGAAPEASSQQEDNKQTNGDETQQISSTGGSSQDQLQPPRQAPVAQGVKRKEGADDRPVDNNATTALLISDLHWWTNEDDVRGWTNQSGCEDELVEITFNEHKVNGKSKGQCFVELSSPQAATALKRTIESFGQGQQYAKKHSASYHAPHINPYRTLPKDVPNRKDGNRSDNRSSSGSFTGNSNMSMGSNPGGGFRGGRGGFNRGGMNNMGYNRGGFSNPMSGGMGPTGGYGNPMGGFGSNPMAMNNMGFNNNFNRGGMMGGMRGGMGGRGRGGMNSGMNPGMMGGMGPMGGMAMNPGMMGGMGAMGGNMNMGMGGMQGQYPNNNQSQNQGPQHRGGGKTPAPVSTWTSLLSTAAPETRRGDGKRQQGYYAGSLWGSALMRSGFGGGGGGQGHFNPAFFNQQSGGDASWGNPHGAKRPRPE